MFTVSLQHTSLKGRLALRAPLRMLQRHVKKTLLFLFCFNIAIVTLIKMDLFYNEAPVYSVRLEAIGGLRGDAMETLNALDMENSVIQSDGSVNVPDRKLTSYNNTKAPLVTLFTTFKVGETRRQVNMNTLRLWASLRPSVRCVMFTTPDDESDVEFMKRAQELGWLIYSAPSLRKGYPIVRDMFTFVLNHVTPSSLFIGYANSDIIFTEDLNETLTYLAHAKWRLVEGKGLLLVGRRTDMYAHLLPIRGPVTNDYVKRKNDGRERSGAHSLDYFITTSRGYPIERLPDFVVGKPGYDNWILIKAIDWKIRAVDCSRAITALHQVKSIPNLDGGWYSNNTCMNRELTGSMYLNKGATFCAPYLLKRRDNTQVRDDSSKESPISLYKRTLLRDTCTKSPAALVFPYFKTCEQIVKKKQAEMKATLVNQVH